MECIRRNVDTRQKNTHHWQAGISPWVDTQLLRLSETHSRKQHQQSPQTASGGWAPWTKWSSPKCVIKTVESIHSPLSGLWTGDLRTPGIPTGQTRTCPANTPEKDPVPPCQYSQLCSPPHYRHSAHPSNYPPKSSGIPHPHLE